MKSLLFLLNVGLVALCAACAARSATAQSGDTAHVRAERVVRSNIAFSADAHVEQASGAPRLVMFVHLQNLIDSTIEVSSSASNCETPFELENLVTGRRFVWNHVAWRRHHEPLTPPPMNDVVCIGTGLLVSLEPRAQGRLGRQVYGTADVRGDSIPAGEYAVSVPVILEVAGRDETLRVWSGVRMAAECCIAQRAVPVPAPGSGHVPSI